jgi:hypothetical protein
VYIVAVHDVSSPEKFWAAVQAAQIPEGVKLHNVLPNSSGSRAVCLWEADTQGTVENLVQDAVGEFSRNVFFEVDAGTAVGLPG